MNFLKQPNMMILRKRWTSAAGVCVVSLLVTLPQLGAGQQPTTTLNSETTQQDATASHTTATPLSKLVEEAQQNNPRVIAALRAWQAAEQVPSQVSTLPDPQVTVQQLAVGSPRPFAGFSNSDFAYIGLGISQDLPYPGKLRLQGEAAKRQAAASREQVESV
ncbi:MAG TPA: TolC family protein, partial [Terriglobia bacterium]|nr:TolC family protein [Terriglobia bacterium]